MADDNYEDEETEDEETEDEESSEDEEWSLGDWSIDQEFEGFGEPADPGGEADDFWGDDDGEPLVDVGGLFGGVGFALRETGRALNGLTRLIEFAAKHGWRYARDKLQKRDKNDDEEDEEDDDDEDWGDYGLDE